MSSAAPGSVKVATVWLLERAPSTAVTVKPPVGMTGGSVTLIEIVYVAACCVVWSVTVNVRLYVPSSPYV